MFAHCFWGVEAVGRRRSDGGSRRDHYRSPGLSLSPWSPTHSPWSQHSPRGRSLSSPWSRPPCGQICVWGLLSVSSVCWRRGEGSVGLLLGAPELSMSPPVHSTEPSRLWPSAWCSSTEGLEVKGGAVCRTIENTLTEEPSSSRVHVYSFSCSPMSKRLVEFYGS